MVAKRTIKGLGRAEIEEFIDFCKKPPASWIGQEIADRFTKVGGKLVPNPKWHPFVNKMGSIYKLSDSRCKSAIRNFSIVILVFLIQQEYLIVNPINLITTRKKDFYGRHRNFPG